MEVDHNAVGIRVLDVGLAVSLPRDLDVVSVTIGDGNVALLVRGFHHLTKSQVKIW